MRSYPKATFLGAAALAMIVSMLSTSCSSANHHAAESTTTPASTATSELPPLPAEPTRPGVAGVSPAGVTTAVDVPSDATESQYGQACLAAKTWMDGRQGGDPKNLVEPYLKVLQAPDFSDPGNFNTPWAILTPAQQAGVIMAVNAAARGECT